MPVNYAAEVSKIAAAPEAILRGVSSAGSFDEFGPRFADGEIVR